MTTPFLPKPLTIKIIGINRVLGNIADLTVTTPSDPGTTYTFDPYALGYWDHTSIEFQQSLIGKTYHIDDYQIIGNCILPTTQPVLIDDEYGDLPKPPQRTSWLKSAKDRVNRWLWNIFVE